MRTHKTSKKRNNEAFGSNRKNIRYLSKLGLALGGLLLALLVAFTSLRSAGSGSHDNTKSSDAAGNHVRREQKNTLSPGQFVGKVAFAYQLAREIPHVLDELYCYCHCDKSIGHVSLLSCYTDNHAANCGVCQDEAIDAAAMLKKGFSVPEIRHNIDQKYGRV